MLEITTLHNGINSWSSTKLINVGLNSQQYSLVLKKKKKKKTKTLNFKEHS